MGWAVVVRVASHPARRAGEDHPEEAVQRVRGHTEGHSFLWGMHSSLNSHQSWEEAGQGLGDLLTVVASSLHPAPKLNLGGRRVKERNTRAEGQASSDFYCW